MKAKGTDIANAISNLTKVVGNVDFVHFNGRKNKLLISLIKDSTCAEIEVACEDAKIKFSCPLNTIRTATNGKGDLDFTLKDNILTFSSGRFKASIPTTEYSAPIFEDIKTTEIDETTTTFLIEGYNITKVTSQYEGKSLEYVTHNIDKKSSLIYSADAYHFAICRVDRKLPELNVPQYYFDLATKLFKGKGFKLGITDSTILFVGEGAKLQLPTIDVLTIPSNSIKQIYDVKTKESFTIDSSVLMTSIENIIATFQEDTPLVLSLEKGKLYMECASTLGSISDSVGVKSKDKFRCSINVQLFLDLLSLVTGEITVGFNKENKLVVIECNQSIGKVHYICTIEADKT